jgi:thiol reductant ABC exporter CydC subunit
MLGTATVGSSVLLLGTSAYLIARAAQQPSIAALQVAIVGVRFFGLSRGVFRYLERYVSHTVTLRLLARWRVWFYNALEPLAPARLMGAASGDLLSRMVADIDTLQNFYVRVVAPPLVALLIGLGMAGYLAGFSSQLAALLLVIYALAGLGLPALVLRLDRAPGRERVLSRGLLYRRLVDGVQGMSDLLAFGAEGRQSAAINAAAADFIRAEQRQARLGALERGLSSLGTYLGTWGVLVLAIPLVSAGKMDGVYLAAIVLAAVASFEAVLPLLEAARYLASSLAAARRLFELAGNPPAVADNGTLPPPADLELSFHEVWMTYEPDQRPAVAGLSFELPQGGRTAIVGPSGAGKTSVANILLRFWEYEKGEVLLGGRDLRGYAQELLRQRIGVVSQDTYLFNATIRENLLLARPKADENALIEAAQAAQIHAFIERLPQGYDTWVGEHGLKLSGGERQRLGLARIFLKNPSLLILDEPTANLDSRTEREIMDALAEAMAGRSVMLITHRLVGLEAMDEIIVLDRGRVVERDRHAALLAQHGLYHQMWSLQNQYLRE